MVHSAIATPSHLRDVGRIVLDEARRERVTVVVSAFQGVTNQLLDAARLAERGDTLYERSFDAIARRHRATVDALTSGRRRARTRRDVDEMLARLHEAQQGIHLLRHCPPRGLDLAASFGERLSALIFAAYLDRSQPAAFASAREFVVTDDQFTQATIGHAARLSLRPELRPRGSRRSLDHLGLPTGAASLRAPPRPDQGPGG
jgi:aspartokinase/homoserine dehydrogenase 1